MLATYSRGIQTYSASTTMQAQDVHISCPESLVETLVNEFKQQFTGQDNVEVYDWGWSCRFRTGYVVLAWRESIPAEFEAQLDADPRLLGHSVYILPERLTKPGPSVVHG